MTKLNAERIIAQLDNLSARCRDIETGIDRIRMELQDEFRLSGYGYAPKQRRCQEQETR